LRIICNKFKGRLQLIQVAAKQVHLFQETNASELNAYPNPTSGKMNVIFNGAAKEKYTLKVVDMIGNVLISNVITAVDGERNTHDLDLTNVAKGMYLLSIQKEGAEAETMRIVVE